MKLSESDTDNNLRDLEQISAMVDGESDSEITCVLTATQREGWEMYHLIGDVMREPDLCVPVSDSFIVRLQRNLDHEGVHHAVKEDVNFNNSTLTNSTKTWQRLTWFGGAAVAAAAVAAVVISVPQIGSVSRGPITVESLTYNSGGNSVQASSQGQNQRTNQGLDSGTFLAQFTVDHSSQVTNGNMSDNRNRYSDFIRIHNETANRSPFVTVSYSGRGFAE